MNFYDLYKEERRPQKDMEIIEAVSEASEKEALERLLAKMRKEAFEAIEVLDKPSVGEIACFIIMISLWVLAFVLWT